MKILIGDIYSRILEPRKHISALAEIRQVCKARPDGYQYMPKFKAGFWDGYVTLMPTLSSFPTGLLDQVLDMLKSKYGYDIDLQRYGTKPDIGYSEVTSDVLKGVTLRDYQVEAANTLLDCKRGVAGMATNSGKTEIMAAIAWALKCNNVLILEARKELMYQTASRLSTRLGVDVGLIGDGLWEPKSVTVGMVQTLSKRSDLAEKHFAENNCVMVDECHHTSSDTVLEVLTHIPGPYRFGFSGTPLKHDALQDLKLMAYTGPVKYWLSNQYLISAGYSARPFINMYEVTSDDGLWGAEYPDAYQALIVDNNGRNTAISELAKEQPGVVLILVERIDHGDALNEYILGSVFVNGHDPIHVRNEVLHNMAHSTKGVFIATPIFDEGVDVPSVDTVILAGGGKSPVKLLQRLGRGMRRKDTNNTLTVIDFIDTGNKHLLNHTEARLDVYAQEHLRIIKHKAVIQSQ